MTRNARWTTRLKVTSNVVHVGAFVLAVAGAIVPEGMTTANITAILLSAIGIVLATLVDVPFANARRGSTLIAVSILLYSVSIGLTGGVGSPFVLMPVAAIFLAAVAGGAPTATAAAVLSVAGFMTASWLSDSAATVDALIRVPAIYVITAIAISEVRRALQRESERADDLAVARSTSEGRRERMEATHDLLEDLMDVATSPDINAVAAAHDGLRDLGVIVPEAPARIVTVQGVNLAFRGQVPDVEAIHTVPIERGDTRL
ncbi:MAG: hypothetical protein ACR2N2_02575, partial [Acidimicrobiia bacterium]